MIESGTVLQNRYLVLNQIGQGGMGAVYIATDQRFGSTVALKETLFADPNLRKAFEREARLLNHLHHPALPKITDHFLEENGQFLVMEFIPGDDLSDMLKNRGGAFPLDDVLKWADQLLDALDYLHTQEPSVVHRDIKPQNLKLTPRGHIVLLDFGLAKGTTTQMSKVTATGSIFGYSRNYAPLEQIQGTGTDPRSDLYSLGATLYHLMTGTTPIDALTRATDVLNGQPDPLLPADEVNPQLTTAIASVLSSAMSQNAGQRPQTAAAMRQALQDASRVIHVGAQKTEIQTHDAKTISDQETQLMNPPGGAPLTEKAAGKDGKTNSIIAYGGVTSADAASAATTPISSTERNRESESVITKVKAPPPPSKSAWSGRAPIILASISILAVLAMGVYTLTRKPNDLNQQTAPQTESSPTGQQSNAPPSPVGSPVNNSPATTTTTTPAPVASSPEKRSSSSSSSTASAPSTSTPSTVSNPKTPATPTSVSTNTGDAAVAPDPPEQDRPGRRGIDAERMRRAEERRRLRQMRRGVEGTRPRGRRQRP